MPTAEATTSTRGRPARSAIARASRIVLATRLSAIACRRAAVQRRQVGQPPAVVAVAQQAEQRLYRRFHRLVDRGTLRTVAATAVARELCGFLWAAMVEAPVSPRADGFVSRSGGACALLGEHPRAPLGGPGA